jgi:broad specificity phosphatase PhoE
MTSTIYLIRHATPDWSRTEIRYDVPPGPPLTTQGEAEAIRLGEFLREAQVYKLYASPLARALRTAEIAGEITGNSVEVVESIAEWRRGESEAEVLERFTSFWTSVCEKGDHSGAIAVVTHGGPIRLMLDHLKLERAEIDFYRKQFDRDNPVPPAGAWRIMRTSPQTQWQITLAFTPQPYRAYQPQIVYV